MSCAVAAPPCNRVSPQVDAPTTVLRFRWWVGAVASVSKLVANLPKSSLAHRFSGSRVRRYLPADARTEGAPPPEVASRLAAPPFGDLVNHATAPAATPTTMTSAATAPTTTRPHPRRRVAEDPYPPAVDPYPPAVDPYPPAVDPYPPAVGYAGGPPG